MQVILWNKLLETPFEENPFVEKRFSLRMSLRLPIVISGRARDGSTWSEATETENISTTGSLFEIQQKVAVGEILSINSHRPDGTPVEVTAAVVHVNSGETDNSIRIGVAIHDSLESWLRLFVAWAAEDNLSSTSNIPN